MNIIVTTVTVMVLLITLMVVVGRLIMIKQYRRPLKKDDYIMLVYLSSVLFVGAALIFR
jgi:hypothetical protein